MYLRLLFCFFTDEKPDSSLPLYVLPLYSLLAPEKQAKVKDSYSQEQMALTDTRHCRLKSHVFCELKCPPWTIHQWADLNGSMGRLGWVWSRPRVGCDLPDVLVQQAGRGEKRQSSSTLKLLTAMGRIRILDFLGILAFPLGLQR